MTAPLFDKSNPLFKDTLKTMDNVIWKAIGRILVINGEKYLQ